MRRIRKICESGGALTESDLGSYNSYKGWLDWGDCSRLADKYLKPLNGYIAERIENERLWKGQGIERAI